MQQETERIKDRLSSKNVNPRLANKKNIRILFRMDAFTEYWKVLGCIWCTWLHYLVEVYLTVLLWVVQKLQVSSINTFGAENF